jgi:hypothetical protein
MKKFYSLSICLALFLSVLIVGDLEAATYYIDGSNGSDSNPGTIASPWKTISKANTTLRADDTVLIKAGTYSPQQINPSHSGSSGKYITYQNYNDDKVIISNRSYGYVLKNVNYIKIDSIRFDDIGFYFGHLKNAEYCIIQNCEFYKSKSYGGTKVGYSSNYNKFLNNVFEDAPINTQFELTNCDSLPYGSDCDCDTAPADFISIYSGIGNIIEGNIFGTTSHGCVNLEPRNWDPWGDSKSDLTVVRNNTFVNKYHTGMNANCMVLAEGNRFYDMGSKCKESPSKKSRDRKITDGHPGIYVMSSNSIVRNNICDNNGWGILLGAKGGGSYVSEHERYYHNTLYNNHYQVMHSGNSGAAYNDNVFKNNIFYNAQSREWSNYADFNWAKNTKNYFINNSFTPNASSFYFKNTNTISRTLAELKNLYPSEWHSSNFSVDPEFTNASNRDFTLKSSSPLIDNGAWLTTITSSTANRKTSFTVVDSRYFYDGWGIPGEIGDRIKTQQGETTTITNINYDTNTITVTDPIDIVNGEGLSLNYFGSAPDIGAHEYGNGSALAAPARLKLLYFDVARNIHDQAESHTE